ncbi:MAG: integration host factor subunit beta [Phycisphaerae bacterium]|nr:integration host factor subunit beta [Phycisphaerae bacterium]
MATVTKKELIDRIADQTATKRVIAKRIIQSFLDAVIDELRQGNRLEFRDFGVFEHKDRQGRMAQNPKTLEQVAVPAKRTVKFKMGRLMKKQLQDSLSTRGPRLHTSGDGAVAAKPAD